MEEKIEFDGQKYRTPKFKEVFDYIYKEINELEDVLNKTGDNLSKVSRLVLKTVVESLNTKKLQNTKLISN